MALNETGAISVDGLQSPSKWIHSFLIEVYSDSGLTNLVARKQPLFKWNQPTLTNLQQEISTIAGLDWGTTYYVRVGSVTPVTGVVNWSATVQVQAGDSVIGGPTITAPNSQTAPANEFFNSYNSGTGTFGTAQPVLLKTDGVDNDVQDTLDLVAGTNITLTDNGDGSVTIDAGSGGAQPVAFTVVFPNTASGRQVWAFLGASDFTLTIASSLTNWRAHIGTNPSTTKTFSFKKAVFSGGSWGAPSEFGTLQITSGGALTWTSASGSSIGDNEALVIDEPSDGSLANVAITIHGTR
jgi:hypothetical protein